MRPPPTSGRPAPSPVPPTPLFAPTGSVSLDALADVIDQTAAPFRTAPDPRKGELGAVTHVVGGALGVVSGAISLLDTGIALATAGIASVFPSMPAATLGTLHVAPPHPHAHPPSLVPPAPPVPLPSLGAVAVSGCVSVLIDGVPAARCGDFGLAPTCGGLAPVFEIKTGSSNVFIGGSRAARELDITTICTPSLPPVSKAARVMASVMTGIGVAGVAVGALDAVATAQVDPLAASVMAAQAAADAAALAMGVAQGKDPGTPPLPGALVTTGGTVEIGGFPMPDTLSALSGILKAAQKLGKGLRGGRRAGKLFCLKC